MVEFDPLTYSVEEGMTANLRIVLVGQSAVDVGVDFSTADDSATGETGRDNVQQGHLGL